MAWFSVFFHKQQRNLWRQIFWSKMQALKMTSHWVTDAKLACQCLASSVLSACLIFLKRNWIRTILLPSALSKAGLLSCSWDRDLSCEVHVIFFNYLVSRDKRYLTEQHSDEVDVWWRQWSRVLLFCWRTRQQKRKHFCSHDEAEQPQVEMLRRRTASRSFFRITHVHKKVGLQFLGFCVGRNILSGFKWFCFLIYSWNGIVPWKGSSRSYCGAIEFSGFQQ